MISAELRERVASLPPGDRARVLEAVIAPLKKALAQFSNDEITEKELIIVELAVNSSLDGFPGLNGTDRSSAWLWGRLLELTP